MTYFDFMLPSFNQKIVQPSTEAMVRASQDSSKNQVSKDSSNPTSSNSSLSKERVEQVLKQMNVTKNDISNQDSVKRIGRLDDLNSKFSIECDREVCLTGHLKKSQSVESGLYRGIPEGDEDLGFSCDSSKIPYDSTISICRKYHDTNPIDQCKKNPNFEFQVIRGLGNGGSIFSVGDLTPSDKDAREIPDTPLSGDLAGDSAEQTSGPSTPSLTKSHSLPNIKASTLSSEKFAFKHASLMSRSTDDLHALGMWKKEVCNDSDEQIRGVQERENNMENAEENHMGRYFDDGFDSYLLSSLAKDWVMPITDDTSDVKPLQEDSSVDCLGEFPNKDFKIKRIEDWVTGLQHCGPPLVEETNELLESVDPVVDVNTINGVVTTAGVDRKITPGMEAAKRYISSLSANATAAQLANHGLVVMPFLSAFVSLKVLNLAGNAIG